MPGRNDKLLEQLALAKEAGTKAMAKDFFAPTPGASPAESGMEGSPAEESSESPGEAKAEGDLTPEHLEELMRLLEQQGGAGGGNGM